MIPMGYSRKSIGMFLAVTICIGAGVLLILFINSGATLSDMKYFGIVALILALLCVVSDITSNIKNGKKIAHRKAMLSCPKVRGKVVAVKRNPYYFGREFKETPNVYEEGRNAVFRIVASVNSPLTGKEIFVTSEAYSRNVNSFISDGFVDVHYSSDGEYWIELV